MFVSKTKKINPNPQPIFESSFSNADYFDDCHICQAQKLADKEHRNLTESEFKETALKAKKNGAIVGGNLLDKSLN